MGSWMSGPVDCPALVRATNGTLPGFEGGADGQDVWQGDFTFIQAADTQFGLLERYIEHKPTPHNWEQETKWAQQAVAAVNAMKPRPRFMVVCGDLVDATPVQEGRKLQVQTFFQVFSQLCPDIPLICVCGNHDIGDRPTPSSVQTYRDDFGDDYFAFWVGGVRFLVLNSQFYQDASLCPELKDKQDQWLDKQLSSPENAKAQHILVFQHIPWFITKPDEADEYFNIASTLREKMLTKFYSAGVSTIFCGHYHRNAGGMFRNMELVVTSAIGVQLGDDGNGFRVVKVTEKAVTHKYHTLKELCAGDKC